MFITSIPALSSKTAKYIAGNCLDQGKGGSLFIAQAMKLINCEAMFSCFIKSLHLHIEFRANEQADNESLVSFIRQDARIVERSVIFEGILEYVDVK
jgi:hypothetical protein